MEEIDTNGYVDVFNAPARSVVMRELVGTKVVSHVILAGELVAFEVEQETVAALKISDAEANIRARDIRSNLK